MTRLESSYHVALYLHAQHLVAGVGSNDGKRQPYVSKSNNGDLNITRS